MRASSSGELDVGTLSVAVPRFTGSNVRGTRRTMVAVAFHRPARCATASTAASVAGPRKRHGNWRFSIFGRCHRGVASGVLKNTPAAITAPRTYRGGLSRRRETTSAITSRLEAVTVRKRPILEASGRKLLRQSNAPPRKSCISRCRPSTTAGSQKTAPTMKPADAQLTTPPQARTVAGSCPSDSFHTTPRLTAHAIASSQPSSMSIPT